LDWGGVLIFSLLVYINFLCQTKFSCSTEMGSDFLLTVTFVLIPFFLFSLITYKMKEEVFVRWWKFTRWWIPLTMFLTLITPDSNSVIMSWGKEVPAMGMTILYIFISSIIILRTWLKTRKEGK